MLDVSSSLMFDLEEEDGRCSKPNAEGSKPLRQRAPAAVTSSHGGDFAVLTQPRSLAETKLVVDVATAMTQSPGGVVPVESLARSLRSMGYWTLIRTALGGDRGLSTMTNLKHTFLLCMLPGTTISQLFVVDPNFRDSFEIALPTPRYSTLIAAVPPVFIGTPEYLSSLVPLLCAEMEHAFLSRGATLPPWRQAGSMLARWHSKRIVDIAVSSRGQLMEVHPVASHKQGGASDKNCGDVVSQSLGQVGGTTRTKVAPTARRCSWEMPEGPAALMPAPAAGPRAPGGLQRRRSDLSTQLSLQRSNLSSQLERHRSDLSTELNTLRAVMMAELRSDDNGRRPLGSASSN